MTVLDTNILSETLKPAPEPAVIEWLDSLPPAECAITVITVAELLYGIGRLPHGKHRRELTAALEQILAHEFTDRILVFDADAAVEYADIVVDRESAGRPISMADAQIAAICRSRQCALATRNEPDFVDTGVQVVNPWSEVRE